MFTLELYDRKGQQLNIGDIVRVSDGRGWSFYSEVKYLEEQQTIAPFHTFSFHSFEKIDKIPESAIKSSENRYNIWFDRNPELDINSDDFEAYLIQWRECEHLIEDRCYRIKKS